MALARRIRPHLTLALSPPTGSGEGETFPALWEIEGDGFKAAFEDEDELNFK